MQELYAVSRPEEAGISSRGILDYIAAREEAEIEPHAIWVMRHGKVACKLNYAPYDDAMPHMLFSLSKSFCSAAAGFAVQEGLLSWDSRVCDVLPEKAPENASDWLQSITLHHLLTMGSGLKPESDQVQGEDWASLILSCDCDHEPGTHFHYNSRGTYLVSCMVQRVTGMTVRDYLVPRLFAPLGLMNADGTPPLWDCCPAGVNTGGWGLWLSCGQIARFGQCLLQKGVWDGVQVLPAEWLSRATVAQIDNANGGEKNSEWSMGYGYQFWMCSDDRYRGDGAFAQLCIVDEKRDMVVACVSGVPDIGKALALINEHLFAAADMPPAADEEQAALQTKLAALSYSWPEHDGSVHEAARYEAEGMILDIAPEQVTLTLNESDAFPVGQPAQKGSLMSMAGWQGTTLSLVGRIMDAPFMLRAEADIAPDEATVKLGGIGPKEMTVTLKKSNKK